MKAPAVLGLDVGGAHLKAALVEGAGRVLDVREVACPLWQGLERLDAALADLPQSMCDAGTVAATMTGELVDLFPDRAHGVRALVEHLVRRLGDRPLALFAGDAGFLAPEEAKREPGRVASANWLATATLCAARIPCGLLVDVGSTTTDLVPFAGGRVLAQERDDFGRLAAGELVWAGVVRTPLCALGPDVAFRGARRPLAAEWFATTADVFRLTGELREEDDRHPAADGGPKTREGSARRILRMVGADLGPFGPADAEALARAFRARLLHRLEEAALGVLERLAVDGERPVVVATGAGAFLARELARRLGLSAVGFGELLGVEEDLRHDVDVCAPAVAVAVLFTQQA